jgi:hypothetical protein
MSKSGPLKYMRCIAATARQAPIRSGTYSPILGIDGSAPCRTAIIVDNWGEPRAVREDECGRWQLFVRDDGPVAEFIFA